MPTDDERYMRRCIELARNGRCNVAPNPMVGAVIVCDGRIIGEGYHIRCGEAHAEVNAIRSVKRTELLTRSTIYVSLEPCSHYGKTPPCADLIVERQIPRIVVGCTDPFSEVAGRGIAKLRAAGREVVTGVLEDECRRLVRRFITFHTQKRPYITLKWAQSADRFIDRLRTEGTPVILSTPLTSLCTHKLRAESDAILVSGKTALLDNPSLTVRHWQGKNPVRVVLSPHTQLPPTLHLFDGEARTLAFTSPDNPTEAPNAERIELPPAADPLHHLLRTLYEMKLQSLLVEGGSRLLQSFIDAELWDEIRIEQSPIRLESGVEAPEISPRTVGETEIRFGRNIFHYVREEI